MLIKPIGITIMARFIPNQYNLKNYNTLTGRNVSKHPFIKSLFQST